MEQEKEKSEQKPAWELRIRIQ